MSSSNTNSSSNSSRNSNSISNRRSNTESTLPLYHHDDDYEFPLRPIPEDVDASALDAGTGTGTGSSSFHASQPLTRQQLSLTAAVPTVTAVTPYRNRPTSGPGSVASSTKAVQAGHAGSVISDAAAVLADSDIGGAGAGTTTTSAVATATTTEGAAQPRSPQHHHHHRRRRRRRQYSVIALCLVGVTVVAVLVAVFTMRNDNNDNNDNNENDELRGSTISPAPTLAPASNAPTIDPDVTATLDAILRTVPTENTDALYDSPPDTSPQSRARLWMLETDQLRDSLLLGSNEERVRQRYALAVFYYGAVNNTNSSTRADTNTNNTDAINNAMNNANATDSTDTNEDDEEQEEWLQPDISECEWTGLECDESDTLVYMHLGASNMSLTGTLPVELAVLTGLREVDLHGNGLTGSLPATVLLAWQDLFWMDLSENQLTGSIPDILWSQLQVLRYVYLHDNSLTGELVMNADAADQADNNNNSSTNPFLEDVWLYNNLLQGPLPTWMVTLTSLQSWITFGNAMTGPLPDFGTAFLQHPDLVPQNLIFLDVSDNDITGTLPESLFTVPAATLRFLYLDRNQLRGPLPPGNQSAVLEEVWLYSNQFTGTVPVSFGSEWQNLQELRLQDNNVTGILALGGSTDCSRKTLLVMQADCSNDTVSGVAEVTCPCCTECF